MPATDPAGHTPASFWNLTGSRVTVWASLARVGGRLVSVPVKTTAAAVASLSFPLPEPRCSSARKQAEQRAAAGTDWLGTGYVFTTPQRATGRAAEPLALLRPDRRRRGPAPHRVPRPATDGSDTAQGPR